MRFSINTLGCKVNLYESEEISRLLAGSGFRRVDYRSGKPHLCIINTCTVTSKSDRKVRQLIRKLKKINNSALLAVTGCFIENNRDFLKENNVDFVLENDRKDDIPTMVKEILALMETEDTMSEYDTGPYSDTPLNHSRPMIKVQDGCEQHCTYCIIPIVRGGYKSMQAKGILRNIQSLVQKGFEEVVLTGIHIGKYGIEAVGDNLLYSLLGEILSKTYIRRIRISSLEINEIDSLLLKVLKGNKDRIAPHLHIPLQSGSDAILEKMGRPYDSGYFRDGIRKIKSILPGTAFTTDVMVGFPGETEKDFTKTMEIVTDIGFSKLHVFRYSPRPGTRAFLFKDMVSGEIKNRRSRVLLKQGDKMRRMFIERNIGKVLEVAVEKRDTNGTLLSGISGDYIKVYFDAWPKPEKMSGKIIRIKAEKTFEDGLVGVVIDMI